MVDADTKAKLDAQVKVEREELLAAPRITQSGTVARCHFCGQPLRSDRVRTELHKQSDGHVERVRGECCGA